MEEMMEKVSTMWAKTEFEVSTHAWGVAKGVLLFS